MGIYSLDDTLNEALFISKLQQYFKFAELRLNVINTIQNLEKITLTKQMQVLSLEDDYGTILKKYNRNRKRELAKAKKHDLVEKWDDTPAQLIQLFKENIAARVKGISQKEYQNLLKLIATCFEKKVGELLTVYSSEKELVSAAFFIKYKHKVTQIVCASDLKNRDNGANTFSNDRAIFKYQKNFEVYDFGGSSIKSIAKYYTSFGAQTETYPQLKYNNLPRLLKLFKR
jgi:hypothetical protein